MYKVSKRRIISEFKSNDNTVKFDYFDNEAMTPDDKYFLITVDHSKEDYAANSNLWIRNNRKIFPKMKEKMDIDLKDIAERRNKIQSLRDKFAKDFTVELGSREHLMEDFLKNMFEEIPDATTHALGGAIVTGKYGEGILDFVYADFDKIYNELKDKEFIVKYPLSDGNSILDQMYNQYINYCNTLYNYEDLFAASLYTYICPPIFVNADKQNSYLQFYMIQLKYWQSVYRDMLEFCYDENYYPEFLGNLCPHERYYLYCEMQRLPTSVTLRQKHSIVHNKITGNKMPYGLTEEEIDERYNNAIKLTKSFKKFAKEYECRPDILHMLFESPRFIHICYEFSKIEEMLNIEFMRMLELNLGFIKCQRCGKYFIRKTEGGARYCDRIEPGTNKTCKDLAAIDNFKEKNKDNIPLQIYNLYYKRYSARIQGSKKRRDEFKKWKFESSAKKIDCEEGRITVYEYDDWNYDYFPNRPGTKFFKDKKRG